MNKKNIGFLFDGKKTVRENSINIGVSERAVKYFMERNKISGQENNSKRRILELMEVKNELENEGIKTTVKNLSKRLGWSNTTVIKYKKIIENSLKEGNMNLPSFGIKRCQVIKSYSYSQDEILRNILNLHIENKRFFADVTYSVGNFYEKSKIYCVPQPVEKYDVYPQMDDVTRIEPFGKFPFKNISSLVIDLPFTVSPDTPSTKVYNKKSNIIQRRFFSYPNKENMFHSYRHFIEESYRTLKYEGVLVMKTQGCVSSATNLFIPEYCFMVAVKCGFQVADQFFLIAKNRLHSSKIEKQYHSRKYTSTFWVFRKTKKKKVDYFSMIEK